MSVSMLLLLAVLGLAFDLGRVYIARNEAQIFADAAAMAAASKLDGTAAGIAQAHNAVEHLPGRWNLGTSEFKGIVVEFSADGTKWEADPKDATAVKLARVIAPDNNLEITFLRAVGGPANLRIAARSAAASDPPRWIE